MLENTIEEKKGKGAMLAQILNSGSEFGMLACQLGKECSFQAFFFFLKAPCLQ